MLVTPFEEKSIYGRRLKKGRLARPVGLLFFFGGMAGVPGIGSKLELAMQVNAGLRRVCLA